MKSSLWQNWDHFNSRLTWACMLSRMNHTTLCCLFACMLACTLACTLACMRTKWPLDTWRCPSLESGIPLTSKFAQSRHPSSHQPVISSCRMGGHFEFEEENLVLYHWNPCDLKPSFSSLRLTVSNLTCSWVKHSPGNWFPHPWVENVTKGKRAFRNGWPKHCNQKRCNQNALTKSYDEKGQTEEKFFSSAGRTFDRKDENQSQW